MIDAITWVQRRAQMPTTIDLKLFVNLHVGKRATESKDDWDVRAANTLYPYLQRIPKNNVVGLRTRWKKSTTRFTQCWHQR